MADYAGAYVPAHDSVLLYQTEAATLVSAGTVAAVPGSYTLLSLAKPPSVRRIEGNKVGYAVGQRGGQYKLKGGRSYEVGINAHLSDWTFVDACLAPTGLALKYGQNAGTQNAVRGAACRTLSISAGRGDDPIAMNATLLGLIHQYGVTAYTWDSADATAVPYTWHNITDINIGTVGYRPFAMNFTLNVDHGNEPKNTRPDVGDDNVISRTPYAQMPHLKRVTGSISFDTLLPASLFNAADDTTTSTPDISFVIKDSAGTTVRTITVVSPVIQTHGQDESELEGEMINSLTFEAYDITSA